MKLHENIRELRKERNMTQEQLAEAMGVSTASVSKWETAQSAPELTVLMELADYFAVSVDMLMGHTVEPDRVESRLARLKELREAGEYDLCAAEAEKLVRNFPNDVQVLESCSSTFYKLYMVTSEREYMERSAELTRRIMVVEKDSTGAKRFERLSRLANQYQFLGEWEKAEKCYQEGNVGGMNDRALAHCLENAGKDQQALEALSDVFVHNLLWLIMDCHSFANILQEQKKYDAAEAALNWACKVLENVGSTVAEQYAGLHAVLYVAWAALAEEQGDLEKADRCIRCAVDVLTGKGRTRCVDFLEPKDLPQLLGNAPKEPAMLLKMLESSPRFHAVAEETMK